jgi:hypothetical protein
VTKRQRGSSPVTTRPQRRIVATELTLRPALPCCCTRPRTPSCTASSTQSRTSSTAAYARPKPNRMPTSWPPSSASMSNASSVSYIAGWSHAQSTVRTAAAANILHAVDSDDDRSHGMASVGGPAHECRGRWLRGTGPQFGPQTPAHSCHWCPIRRQRCPVIAPDAACSHNKSHTGSVGVRATSSSRRPTLRPPTDVGEALTSGE